MKLIFIVATALALNSCNTMIGLGRDTKAGYLWSKEKIQGTSTAPEDNYGAPVY